MPAYSAKQPSYLTQDPRTQIFYLRFRYTKPLVAVLGGREFKRSLKTKDRDSARFLASFIYRLLRDQLGGITSMDRKWAGVYLKELYQRLLQRGQMALISEDTLSFYRHTGPDGEVRLPPMLTEKEQGECGQFIDGYPYQETFEDFQGWYDLQGRLAKAESEEEKAQLSFEYIQSRKQAEGQLDTQADTAIITGLDRTLDRPTTHHQGQWVKGNFDLDRHIAFALPQQAETEQQKRLYAMQGLGSTLLQSDFSQMLLKSQKELFEALNSFRNKLNDQTVDTEAVIEGLDDSVLLTDAYDVDRQLEAYRDTARALYTEQALKLQGLSEAEFMAQPELTSDQYAELLERLRVEEAAQMQQQPPSSVPITSIVPISADPVPLKQYYRLFADKRRSELAPKSFYKVMNSGEWLIEQYGENWDCRLFDPDVALDIASTLNDGRSASTFNGYMSYMNQYFEWLANSKKITREQGTYLQDKQLKNPKKKTRSNKKYTDDAVQVILNYQPQKSRNGREDSRNWPLAAHWFPKVALYTGMRISEIAELKIADVYQHPCGDWIVEVTDKGEQEEEYDESRSNKTKSAIRLIPLHNTLIEVGFLAFVDKQRTERGSGFLFFELFKGKDKMPKNGWADPISSWFNGRALVNMKLKKPQQTFHSLRTSFISKLKKRGCPMYVAKQLVGHDKVTYEMQFMDVTMDGYGADERTDFDVLSHWVNGVKYE